MFQNYFAATLRHLRDHKLYALINVLGLSIGLASCLLIILFVRHETSYDTFLPNLDRLYRFESMVNIPGRPPVAVPRGYGATKEIFTEAFDEIETYTIFQSRFGRVMNEADGISENFIYGDENLFKVLQLPFIEGDPETAMSTPGGVVLTEEMALKHLGEGPYLGREITLYDQYERNHKVTGILKDIPDTSHIVFDIVLPIDMQIQGQPDPNGQTALERWNGVAFYNYFTLKEGANLTRIENTIDDLIDQYFPDRIAALVNKKGSELFKHYIMPVADIHLKSPSNGGMKPSGSMTIIYSFGGIAIMILAIASINFMNLATARSTLRAREVAVRKVMGANRGQLFWQFQSESLLFAVISLLFAMLLVAGVLPAFNGFTNREISFLTIFEPTMLAASLGLTILVGLVAGIHPSIVLSGIRPSRVLMANKSVNTGSAKLRAGLVILQFVISSVLVIGTGLVFAQTWYAQNRDLGYNRDNLMVIRGLGQEGVGSSQEAFRDRVRQLPGVEDASLSNFGPSDGDNTGYSYKVPGLEQRIIVFFRSIDFDYFDMMDVDVIAGRKLDPNFNDIITNVPNDATEEERNTPTKSNIVINMAAVKALGFGTAENAVGKVIFTGDENQNSSTIVGVIPNVHLTSPRVELNAYVYMVDKANFLNLNVRYSGENPEEVGLAIDRLWQEMFPGTPSFRQYLDENIANQFRGETIQGTLLGVFSGLAILIASMGLFALSSFTVARRTKEIGLRKVMGASSKTIVILLLRQLSTPVLIANIIALPIGWYAISQWMQNFQYRLDMPIYFSAMAVAAIVFTLVLSWATVAHHAIRVAQSKPINALRYE